MYAFLQENERPKANTLEWHDWNFGFWENSMEKWPDAYFKAKDLRDDFIEKQKQVLIKSIRHWDQAADIYSRNPGLCAVPTGKPGVYRYTGDGAGAVLMADGLRKQLLLLQNKH